LIYESRKMLPKPSSSEGVLKVFAGLPQYEIKHFNGPQLFSIFQ